MGQPVAEQRALGAVVGVDALGLDDGLGTAVAQSELDELRAAGLLTDHGLRIGHEPDTRVITDAARYQLGARVVDRHTGVVAHLSDHPKTCLLYTSDAADE